MYSRRDVETLDRILGTAAHAELLASCLQREGTTILLVRGPSGTGKTTLSRRVADEAEGRGDAVVRLVGDPARPDESYYPFRALFRSGGIAGLVDKGSRLLGAIADDLLPMGRSVTKALLSIVTQEAGAAFGVGDAEVPRRFVSLLTRSLRSRGVLIVADDIQYFDRASLALLDGCLDPRAGLAGGSRLGLLSVLNTDVVVDGSPYLRRLLATMDVVTMRRCARAEFEEVLLAFGMEDALPDTTLGALYDCSGGHLQVASSIADDLRGRQSVELDAATREGLLRLTLERRLASSPTDMTAVISLLEPASVVGATFSFEEIGCLAEIGRPALESHVETARDLRFVEVDGGETIRFSHDVLRDYFAERGASRRSGYLEKYAECLRIIRPHDYFARCTALFDARMAGAARVAYCQGQLFEWRSGRYHGEFLPSPRLRDIRLSEVAPFLKAMREADVLLKEGDFRGARTVLAAIGDGIPPHLRAERDYLLAEALLKDLGEERSLEALALLEGHAGLREAEAELWCRMRLLLLLSQVQLGRYDDAGRTDREIASFLSGRTAFDRGAEAQLNRLLALSEMHGAAEVARRRLGQACNYHRQNLERDGSADMYEFFICMTNRSGNSITTGNYAEAVAEARQALGFLEDFEAIGFPARWSPVNNAVVAAVLACGMEPEAAADSLRVLVEYFPLSDDDILLRSNIGGLHVLASDFEAALGSFAAVADRVAQTHDLDPYYRYTYASGRAVALHLSGTCGQADWSACVPLAARLAPAIRADLAGRHEAMSGLFCAGTLGDAVAWDAALAASAAGRPRFRAHRFPRGVFLSDVQIWSGY